jgi:hypothetical protein
VYRVNALVLQLLLEVLNMRAQARVLALQVLRMAAGPGEACNAICCTTLGVVLCAWRAAAGLWVAADLSELRARRVRGSANGVDDIVLNASDNSTQGGSHAPCTGRRPVRCG